MTPMDLPPPHPALSSPARSIVVANAGSGKTWTLANRILAWCMDEVRAGRAPEPARILAVTFTRKAAGEILARILTHAAIASCDTPKGEKARGDFATVVGVATRGQYQVVLGALARDLHRMQVGTIDGFFHRIASALPDEVGLPGEWTIGEDRDLDALRAQAAARVLESDGAAELVALLEEGAPKPSVLRSLTGLLGGTSVSVLDHYRACRVEAPAADAPQDAALSGDAGVERAWRWLARIPMGADLAGERGAASRKALFEKIEKLEIPRKSDKSGKGEPLKVWEKAYARIAGCAQRGDLRAIAEDTAINTMRRTGGFARRPLPPDWAEALELLGPHVRQTLIGDLQGRIDGALEVLPAADAALRQLQEDSGLYAFGDLGRGVARAASRHGTRASSAASLERALGAPIADLAIDEAQDTSAEQFAALRPLIERVLGVGRTMHGEAGSMVGAGDSGAVAGGAPRDGSARGAVDARGDVDSAGDAGPLGAGGAARGRFLLVGDPKQSIYGWRGGTPGLIAEIARRYGSHLDSDAPLTRSYRSSPIVMDFVNRVFADLADDLPSLVEDGAHLVPLVGATEFATREELPDGVLASAFRRAAEEWRFDRHDSADRGRSGWIKAYACGEVRKPSKKGGKAGNGDDAGGDTGDDSSGDISRDVSRHTGDDSALPGPGGTVEPPPEPVSVSERAAAIAAALHHAHPERSIAVLVRTNKAVNETIDALRALGVAASDEGKATLLDSPAVAGVVALLELVDEPANRIAHFIVSRGPLRAASGLAPLEDAASLEAAHADAVRFSRRMRAEIADRGLASVLRQVVRAITLEASRGAPVELGEVAAASEAPPGPGLSPRDRSRLERLVAIAEDFDAAPVARLGEFIDALASDKADASSADRVRVMTVHKSKGLEFDEVVLHGVNEPWGEAPTGWGVLAVDPTKPPGLVAPLSNETVRGWVPELAVVERDERRRRLLDDLSSFYVAITRARRGLHLVVDLKQSSSFPNGARLVARALSRAPSGAGSASADTVDGASDYAVRFDDACTASQRGVLPRATDGPFWESRYDGGDGVLSSGSDGLAAALAGASVSSASFPSASLSGASLPDAANSVATDRAAGEPFQAAMPEGARPETASAQGAGEPLVETIARPVGRAKPPSSHDAPSLWAFDPFGDDDIALRGVLVHECFREIESLATLAHAVAAGAASDASLASLVDRAATRTAIEKATPVPKALRSEAADMLVRIARGAGVAGSIAERLRLAPHDLVRNEFPFLREMPGGGVVSGRIDRLVLHADESGRVAGATILDHKTGAKGRSREQLERTLVGYFAQMHAYCAAVEELWSLPAGAARAALLFVDRDEVIEVPPEVSAPAS